MNAFLKEATLTCVSHISKNNLGTRLASVGLYSFRLELVLGSHVFVTETSQPF